MRFVKKTAVTNDDEIAEITKINKQRWEIEENFKIIEKQNSTQDLFMSEEMTRSSRIS